MWIRGRYKSKGNCLRFQTLKDKGYRPLDYRFFRLGGHDRKQIFFSWDAMDSAKNGRASLVQKIAKLAQKAGIKLEKGKTYKKGEADNRAGLSEKAAGYMDAFKAAMENDLLITVAMSKVNKVLKDSSLDAKEALELIDRMYSVLGLKLIETAGTAQREAQKNAEPAVISHEGDPEAAEIDALVAERTEAKKNKDFAKADEIRARLTERGITIIDTPTGPAWKRN